MKIGGDPDGSPLICGRDELLLMRYARYIFLNNIVVLSRMFILLIVIVSSVWIFYSLTIIDTSEIQVTLKPCI